MNTPGGATWGDRITIERIEFSGRHGYSAAERAHPQRFWADVTLDLPLGAAGTSDRIADTINYEDVCAAVVRIGQETSFHLIEALAAHIAAEILRLGNVTRVIISVWKLKPPIDGHPARTGVTIVREAGGRAT